MPSPGPHLWLNRVVAFFSFKSTSFPLSFNPSLQQSCGSAASEGSFCGRRVSIRIHASSYRRSLWQRRRRRYSRSKWRRCQFLGQAGTKIFLRTAAPWIFITESLAMYFACTRKFVQYLCSLVCPLCLVQNHSGDASLLGRFRRLKITNNCILTF